jgi:hypothetical protein
MGSVLLHRVDRAHPAYDAVRARRIDEARIARTLPPSFLPILDTREDDAGFTVVYRAPTGADVQSIVERLIARGEALPFELAVQIGIAVADAVAFAHERKGLTLPGLDGASVGIESDGNVVLGTHRLDLRAASSVEPDVEAIGTLVFSMLAAHRPEPGVRVPLEILEVEGVPEPLARIVGRAVRPSGAHRGSASDLAAELRAWMGGTAFAPATIADFFRRHGLMDEPIRLLPPPRIEISKIPFVDSEDDTDAEGSGEHDVTGDVEATDRSEAQASRQEVPVGSPRPIRSPSLTPLPVLPSLAELQERRDAWRPEPATPAPLGPSIGSEIRGLFEDAEPTTDPIPRDEQEPPPEPTVRFATDLRLMRRRSWWLLILLLAVLGGAALSLSSSHGPSRLVGSRVDR